MTEITPVAIEDKMKDSYLSYSLSVIVSRALPDVRDGLKPVHRRILYASHELGLTHNKPHKKSARIVGEVLGKYHPHGDAAVYNAMVRMAQPFNQRYPLIDGHGNFGSIDGDSPAAMRYTEARLTEFSSQILKDIKMETVDFSDNFDDSLKEPDVLPSKIPNLLVNGASGIAVGMSTSIPPHNLKEVINVLKHLIKHPNARLDTIIQKMPGPDFPTGAKIVGTEGIKKAYKTGKGKITLRARAHLEKNGRKRQIIITELPYQVNKAKLIEEIADLVKKDKIDNITDIRDESDQEGMRIVVDLKRGADGEIVLNRLFKYSSLQTNFRINLLALNQNRPEVMDIKTMLKHFIEFRQEVITKRTRFKLKKAKARLHLVEGLIKAVDNLDRVITIIRRSESPSEAKEKLINNLKISDKQAKAILDMKLQRLVGMEIKKLRVEAEKLQEKIDKYNKILSDETELNEVLKNELNEIKEKFADKRKTEIIEDESKAVIDKEDLIKEKEALVSLSYRHNIKRTDDLNNIRAAKKDYIINILEGKSLDNLLFFTSSGNVYSLPIHNISEHHGLSTGESLNKYLNIPLKEKIIGTVCLNEKNKEKFITLATAKGMVKKTMGKEYQTTYNKIKAIKLNSGDEVIDTIITDSNDEIILGTKHGKAIRFKGNSINGTGRNTKGYKGINLYKNDRVKSMNKIEDKQFIAAITKSGKGNKSKIENFTLQKRNGRGLNIAAASNYNLQAVIPVNQRDKLLLSTNQESISVINISDMTTVDRPGYMYELMSLSPDEKVNQVEKIALIPAKNELE